MSSNTAVLNYKEFRNNFCEDWGDDFFETTFSRYRDDDTIEIEYKYGDFKNGKSTLKWRIPGTEKFWVVYYTGSSRFAMWWCQQTESDDEEDDE